MAGLGKGSWITKAEARKWFTDYQTVTRWRHPFRHLIISLKCRRVNNKYSSLFNLFTSGSWIQWYVLSPGSAKHYVHMFVTSNGLLLIPILQMRKLCLRNKAFYPRQGLDFTWIQVVHARVGGRRHGWQGERGGPPEDPPARPGRARELRRWSASGQPWEGRFGLNWTLERQPVNPGGVVLVDLLVDLSCF